MKNLKRMESAFMSEFEKVTTGLGEECGVFGAYDMDGGDVAPSVYYGLFALQHRGQESCGIAVTDTYGERKVHSKKGLGLVNEVFDEESLQKLKGNLGVGHVRYSTAGASRAENAMPLVINYVKGILAIAHNGNLTNAGALLADESPVRQSRIFCTRWNGLDMTSGLGEAIDDVELEGCVIGQLQDAVSFVRNNSHKKWWKENDYREELPDYPERAVTEAIANAIIHRDYLQMGSEIHIDMYDDRLEIYSPGGMMDGRLIQQLNPLTVPSKRRNPLLADFFSRLGLMERRGSGMKKIINTYRRYERLSDYHAPEFTSNASEFHVTLWNLNFEGNDNNTTTDKTFQEVEFVKGPVEFTKEFIKASRQIYKLISMNPKVSTVQMADSMGLSTRQVLKYLKRLQELDKIARVGGRKMGEWKIIDEEYEGFFDRI